jgi:hypothetical protein
MASFYRRRPPLEKLVLLGAATFLAASCHPRVSDPHDLDHYPQPA